MKIILRASLGAIKPNAEKNVKLASQICEAGTLSRWIIPVLIGSCAFLTSALWMEHSTYASEDIIPLPGGTSDAQMEAPPVMSPLETKAADKTAVTNSVPTDTLLPITTNKFNVQILKHSISNRIYLLQFSDPLVPKTGEVLLLKSQADSIMAFRVLKVNTVEHTVVGQVIRKYPNHPELQPGEQYEAIEKSGDIEATSDIIEVPEAEFEDPTWSIRGSTPPILPYDPELDLGSSPSPAEAAEKANTSPLSALESKVAFLESKVVDLESKASANVVDIKPVSTSGINTPSEKDSGGAKNSNSNKEDVKMDSKSDSDKPSEKLDDDLLETEDHSVTQETLAIDEVKLLDNHAHWLSAGFGYVTNNSPNGNGLYNFSAGNVKYGVTIGRRFFADKARLQDSLVLEGGIYVYKGINFAAQGDSYTVLAATATLRYNLLFSESFGIFGYAGGMQSNVLATSSGVPSAIAALSSVLPSVGAGILLQIGPSWYARLDIGTDNTSLNLLLRF
jgi:hypothetical protein